MKLGNLDISTVKLGASQVQAIYQGENLVWQNAPVATAATGVGQTSFTANWNAYTGAVVYLLDVSASPTFNTFIYENQITTSTSYVVVGLEPNTTYYYRVRANVGFDSDAQAFFTRVTDAGGTLSTTEQDAVNTLVVQMKADGIWSKMKAIYPMVGASAAACAQNLKSSSFTGVFSGGWTFATTGAKPNGTNAFMNTNLNQLSNFTTSSMHLSYYTNSGTFTANTAIAGITTGPSNTLLFINSSLKRCMNQRDQNFDGPTNIGLGFYCGSRTASTERKSYFNGTSVFTSTVTEVNLVNLNYYLGALNNSGPGFLHGNFECAFSSIGDGLTDTEASNFYTAVQTFQTTISRQV